MEFEAHMSSSSGMTLKYWVIWWQMNPPFMFFLCVIVSEGCLLHISHRSCCCWVQNDIRVSELLSSLASSQRLVELSGRKLGRGLRPHTRWMSFDTRLNDKWVKTRTFSKECESQFEAASWRSCSTCRAVFVWSVSPSAVPGLTTFKSIKRLISPQNDSL